MLEMKQNCESCDTALPPASEDAYICSFECTFCRECSESKLNYVCPNCSGVLVSRPTRKADGS